MISRGYKLKLIVCLLVCWSGADRAQSTQIKGFVRSVDTKEPLPYCAIGIKNSSRGVLSNEAGEFSLFVNANDTVVFSLIGYRKKLISVQDLSQNKYVELITSERLLEEITVLANDERAYQLMAKSRKALMGSISRKAKAYFMLSTEIQRQPVELLECYYSANLNSNRVQELEFKNGRVGLAPFNNRYFVSLDISGAFTLLNLLFEDKRMPENPYQHSIKALKRRYVVKLEESYDSLSPVQIVSFRAKDSLRSFSGKVHILRVNSLPLKIELFIHHTLQHPFRPLFPNAQILDADMRLTKVFDFQKDSLFTHHIDFDYVLNYFIEGQKRKVVSKGLMYFYDYHRPFLPILYPFNPELDDYKKISSLSYNESFWKDNQVLEYSDQMRAQQYFLANNGLTLNYDQPLKLRTDSSEEKARFFESNDLLWSAQQRLSIMEDKIRNDTSGTGQGTDLHYRVNNYAFKANIYLDANVLGDSLQHYSVSVFDVHGSFYNLKTDHLTNCFLNIYFDLLEMERRKMEEAIALNRNSWPHLQACYNLAKQTIQETGLRYFKEVERGHNRKKLEEWNETVYKTLGIDNFNNYGIEKIFIRK